MSYIAKVDFLWYKKGEEVSELELKANPNWARYVSGSVKPQTPVKEGVKADDLDLNDDGVVDGKDASIASKVMNKVRAQKKSRRGKKR